MARNHIDPKCYPLNLLHVAFGNDRIAPKIYWTGWVEFIDQLPEPFRQYVALRYEEGRSLEACGKELGFSLYKIRQLDRHLIQKVRDRKNDGSLIAIPITTVNSTTEAMTKLEKENEQLKQLIRHISDGSVRPEQLIVKDTPPAQSPDENNTPDTPIEDLELSPRAYNALKRNRWDTLRKITEHTRHELMMLPNVGFAVTLEIDELLRDHGLRYQETADTADTADTERTHLDPQHLTLDDLSHIRRSLDSEKKVIVEI